MRRRQLSSARRCADTMRGDLQPRFNEPVFGKFEPLPNPAEHAVRRDRNLIEDKLGMVEDVVMHESRRAKMLDPRRAVINEEQGRLVRIAIHMRVHDDVVAGIIRRHEPFLATDMPHAVAQFRARLH